MKLAEALNEAERLTSPRTWKPLPLASKNQRKPTRKIAYTRTGVDPDKPIGLLDRPFSFQAWEPTQGVRPSAVESFKRQNSRPLPEDAADQISEALNHLARNTWDF